MSRTRRTFPDRLRKSHYDEDFILRMKRGLVALAIPMSPDGGGCGAEVWTPLGKRFSKRTRNRAIRRERFSFDAVYNEHGFVAALTRLTEMQRVMR